MKFTPINVGRENFEAFSMAFLYTKNGMVVYTGSYSRIRENTIGYAPCHGIVHNYVMNGVIKEWKMFGGSGLTVERWTGNDHGKLASAFRNSGLSLPKRTCYVVTDGSIVLGTWRRMPSKYLEQLKNYDPSRKREQAVKAPWVSRSSKFNPVLRGGI